MKIKLKYLQLHLKLQLNPLRNLSDLSERWKPDKGESFIALSTESLSTFHFTRIQFENSRETHGIRAHFQSKTRQEFDGNNRHNNDNCPNSNNRNNNNNNSETISLTNLRLSAQTLRCPKSSTRSGM